jgi:phenylalanine-4-hydroxylase
MESPNPHSFKPAAFPQGTRGKAQNSATPQPAWEKIDNEIVRKLPNYLKQFIVDQNYDAYTPVDHAVWRYVLRQNHEFLREYAHLIYFEGLEKTGLEIERVPSIQEMNKILGKIGWAAVSVNGFIPPAAFMGFQAHRVLVIASDMRHIQHIEYTPSPDIIHEAAGHAPVIADPEYAEYLRMFGEVGAKAMSSKRDFELYEAIRKLSILKETPGTDQREIDEAEKDVHYKQDHLGKPSEMAQLSRLHWWTVEYGLIGDLKNHKIYGAGLLSSIGESFRCMSPKVKKIAYTRDAINYPFDITTEQPHLFVTPDFKHLIDVLNEFASTMAYRTGGLSGIRKAIECKNVSTCQYSSGVQVSGVFNEVVIDDHNQPVYLTTVGPTQLSNEGTQLDGQGREYHDDGFGSPIGRIKGSNTPLETMTDADLSDMGIVPGTSTKLEFESGVIVNGKLSRVERKRGKIILMTFLDCQVTYNGQSLFRPTWGGWGTYDMAVGETIVSVFSGAADKDVYEEPSMVSKTRTIKMNYDQKTRRLHRLYQSIREVREKRVSDDVVPSVWSEVKADYPDEWLLPVEMVEILTRSKQHPELLKAITGYLEDKAKKQPELTKLITDGLRLAPRKIERQLSV